MSGKKISDIMIGRDGQSEDAFWFGQPSGPVDEIPADGVDVVEGPELASFERGISLAV